MATITKDKKKALKAQIQKSIKDLEHGLEMLKGIDKIDDVNEARAVKNAIFEYLNNVVSTSVLDATRSAIYLNSTLQPK